MAPQHPFFNLYLLSRHKPLKQSVLVSFFLLLLLLLHPGLWDTLLDSFLLDGEANLPPPPFFSIFCNWQLDPTASFLPPRIHFILPNLHIPRLTLAVLFLPLCMYLHCKERCGCCCYCHCTIVAFFPLPCLAFPFCYPTNIACVDLVMGCSRAFISVF